MFDASSSSTGPLPEINVGLIRAHLEMIHRRAAGYAEQGKLVVACFGENPDKPDPRTGSLGCPLPPILVHVSIGGDEVAARSAAYISTQPHMNVYASLAVFRPDLPKGSKGAENDIVAVLGLVADFDDAEAAHWGERLPIPPNYVVESSAGRFQAFYLLDKPEPFEAVKPIAMRLKTFARCDHGTADLSHVWRIAGTLNWPNRKKVGAGRSRQPQLVRVIKPWAGDTISLAKLSGLLAGETKADKPKRAAAGDGAPPPEVDAGKPDVDQGQIARLLVFLPQWLVDKIRNPSAEGERSKALFAVISELIALGKDDARIELLIRAHPAGIGAKYVGRSDLGNEIARIRKKHAQAEEAAPAATSGSTGSDDTGSDDTGSDDTGSDDDTGSQSTGTTATSSPPGGPDAPAFSDDALALAFTKRHGHELRYVAKWGAWLRWSGARWEFEDTLQAFDLARVVARASASTCGKPSESQKIASAKTVAAIEKLARADRRHAATVDQWDTDPWLLNTPAGIVDLHTGEMLPHDPARYMTKITAAAPAGGCPLWRAFLSRITGGDEKLQAFLRRVAGYALTGSIREHALFFFFGTGANGKGVFLNTMTAILADYASVAPMETFVVTQGERHPTDLAGLRGARLVAAQETERDRRWAEAKIKALTGGDPITARFMRQDFFTYLPAFKLVIAGNHKPSLSGVDESVRRRFHLVPSP